MVHSYGTGAVRRSSPPYSEPDTEFTQGVSPIALAVGKQERELMPKAYTFGIVHEMRNEDAYQKELHAVRKSITDGGGKFLATGGAAGGDEIHSWFSGDTPPERVTLVEWPDLETAKDWWDNGGEEEVDKLREHADMHTFAVEAVTPK